MRDCKLFNGANEDLHVIMEVNIIINLTVTFNVLYV
jgi:hypothetical protein